VSTFTAAVTAEPGMIRERAEELLEVRREREDKANWVLPSVWGRQVGEEEEQGEIGEKGVDDVDEGVAELEI
jgi:hypothetical protein